MSDELVHIYSGEYQLFWRPDACGYTNDRAEAGIWTREEGAARIKGCGPEKKLKLIQANVTRLERVSRETLILNAHRMAGRKFKGQPLWGFITGVCAVGSHSAVEICRELGWNPHQDASIHLSRKTGQTVNA